MTKHQTAAYGTLLSTADTLRALIANASSMSHPLTLTQSTIDTITVAMNALHEAQRMME